MIIVYGYIFYYIAALLGISVGYHRYFSHRSFNASPTLEYVMLFFGMLCGGRSPLTWAAVHRMHHSTSDTPDDPHSPVYLGVWRVIFSRWHVGYIPKKYIADLIKNPRLVWFHRHGKWLHLAFAIMMALLGWQFFVIFVIMPFVLSYISYGLLNWVTHKNGKPADVPFMNMLAPGEGWHKVHHSRPRSHTLNKFDIAGWVIERFIDKSKQRS